MNTINNLFLKISHWSLLILLVLIIGTITNEILINLGFQQNVSSPISLLSGLTITKIISALKFFKER